MYQPTEISSGGFRVNSPAFGWASNAGGIVIIRYEEVAVQGADTIIPAVPDTIIPATPDSFSSGTVVTLAMVRPTSVQAAGISIINAVGQAALGATRLRLQGGRLFGVPVFARAGAPQQAITALRWIISGMPWFGGAWESALAGQWVRREAWQDLARAVRYVEGMGTTRAVAVRETGERVTTADFGSEEFLGTDWELLDGRAQPAEVDVTDWIFANSGGTPFAVIASPPPTGGGATPPGGGGGATPPGGGGPGDGCNGESCSLTVVGNMRNSIINASMHHQFVLIHNFATIPEPQRTYMINQHLDILANNLGNPACFEYYRALIANNWLGGPLPSDGGNCGGGGTVPGLPSTGEGFLYLRNGTPTLVRARKLSDEEIWRP
jgi:hypothetical protein